MCRAMLNNIANLYDFAPFFARYATYRAKCRDNLRDKKLARQIKNYSRERIMLILFNKKLLYILPT